jgi:hypothetical protein
MPKKKEVHLKKLIKSHDDKEKEHVQESKTQPIVSYWHSNLTIGIVSDNKPLSIQALPEAMARRNSLYNLLTKTSISSPRTEIDHIIPLYILRVI